MLSPIFLLIFLTLNDVTVSDSHFWKSITLLSHMSCQTKYYFDLIDSVEDHSAFLLQVSYCLLLGVD